MIYNSIIFICLMIIYNAELMNVQKIEDELCVGYYQTEEGLKDLFHFYIEGKSI